MNYDVIVIGLGGVGSAAAYHAARRGAKVLGLEQFNAGHDRGSSHGETRVIRQAYFEHPNYVPLLLRAYKLWRELEQLTRDDLLYQVGLLQVGPPGGAVVRGVLEAARSHSLTVDSLTPAEVGQRFPGLKVPDNCVGVFEPAAGYLRVEACVRAHLAAARAASAELRFDCPVRSWIATRDGVEVQTDGGRATARQLIVAAGPWAPRLLAALGISLEVRRKHVYWFANHDDRYRAAHGCPTYLYELPHGVFYGFPQVDARGVKVAEHSGGQTVDDPATEARVVDPTDLARVEAFRASFLPGTSAELIHRSVCFYTMSPDEHFLVDRHPEHASVVFAAGLSGHGFKFTSVLGEALAELALTGGTKLPIGFLSAARFAPKSK